MFAMKQLLGSPIFKLATNKGYFLLSPYWFRLVEIKNIRAQTHRQTRFLLKLALRTTELLDIFRHLLNQYSGLRLF